MLANSQFSYLPYDDYAQSANTLFHFMTKPEYLDSVLRRRAIIPRYCVETIDYLNIHNVFLYPLLLFRLVPVLP